SHWPTGPRQKTAQSQLGAWACNMTFPEPQGIPPVYLSGRRASLRPKRLRGLCKFSASGRARRLEAVTAIDVNVGDAHTAPFLRPGTGVPLPRAGALSGIRLRGNAIGRRTRTRGVGGSGRDPPPLKWSDLRYVFDIKEDCNGKEAIQA